MHTNTPKCASCEAKLTGITNVQLLKFYKDFRTSNLDAHVSCGLRGEEEQNEDFEKGTSRAKFGESAHNFALALDWFRLTHTGASFDAPWFKAYLGPAARSAGLVWGGDFKSIHDLPHVEVKGWQQTAKRK